MLKHFSLNRLLVLLTTAGFLFLVGDSILEHWAIFSQEPVAFTPVVVAAIGLAIGAVTVLGWQEQWIRRFHMFLLLCILVGAAGMYFHIEPFEEDDELLTVEERQHEMNEKEKPLLAPLSFAGLAAVGLLGTSRKWQADVI